MEVEALHQQPEEAGHDAIMEENHHCLTGHLEDNRHHENPELNKHCKYQQSMKGKAKELKKLNGLFYIGVGIMAVVIQLISSHVSQMLS